MTFFKKGITKEINISSFVDIKLREYLAFIEGQSKTLEDLKDKKWTCRDLNPRPPPCQGGDLPS